MRYRGQPSGYTFIEAIAVIAIMVVVGTALLANYDSRRDQRKVQTSTAEVVSALREMQNAALAGTTYAGDTTGVSTKGYGVQISQALGTYTLYADKNGNSIYDNPPLSPADYVIESRTLNEGLVPLVLGWCGSPSSFSVLTPADIVFSPPHPIMSIKKNKDTALSCTRACISFSNASSATINKIIVNQNSGLIDNLIGQQPLIQVFACP